MKKEFILKLLALKKEWKQKDLVEESRSTKGYVSRVIEELKEKNIVTKINRNNLVVIDLPKLLNYWVSLRKLPSPYFIDIKEPVEVVEKKLKNADIEYAITLFRAAWHRLKLLKIDKIEIYVVEKDLQKIFKLIGKSSPFGKIEIYPASYFELFGCEDIKGLKLVPITQNYVDLMFVGGNGTRIALELAKKYDLLGV
jgi:hypothetical protein